MAEQENLKTLLDEVNHLMLATEYSLAAQRIETFLGVQRVDLDDRFYLQGLRCFCFYNNREYVLARETAIQLKAEREKQKCLDVNYLYDCRTLALAHRGLCEFDDCTILLNEILNQARKVADPPEALKTVIADVEKDLDDTAKIRRDEPTDKFSFLRADLVGVFGAQTLGVADLELPAEQMRLRCIVDRLSVRLESPYQFQVEAEFRLDNEQPISHWTVNSETANPNLLVLIMPRGGKVHHGDFELRFLGDRKYDRNVRLQNHYFNIIHPSSYGPRSRIPIPVCKSFQYLRADCSVFTSAVPRHAHIKFKAVLNLPHLTTTLQPLPAIHRKIWFLFPFGGVVISRADAYAPKHVEYGSSSVEWGRGQFLEDQTGFRAGEHSISAPTTAEPEFGTYSTIENTSSGEEGITLSSMEILGMRAKFVPKQQFIAAFHAQDNIIPEGLFNFLPRVGLRRDPESDGHSTFNLGTPELTTRKNVGTVVLENFSSEARSLKVLVECSRLGLHATEEVEVQPWHRMVIPFTARLSPNVRPLFSDGQDPSALSPLEPSGLHLQIVDRRAANTEPAQPLASKIVNLQILRSDFMVWSSSEPSDGRIIDLRYLIARWVTPEARAVADLVREYRVTSGHPNSTMRDAKQLYDRLSEKRFERDHSDVLVGAEMEFRFQRVRTPTETLATRKMNCIDGCVLFASCVEALGHAPTIVFLPGHAICAISPPWDLDPSKHIRPLVLVETTFMCSRAGFDESVKAATDLFESEAEYLLDDKRSFRVIQYEGGLAPHRIVPIALARRFGIEPFPNDESARGEMRGDAELSQGDDDTDESAKASSLGLPIPKPSSSWLTADEAAELNIQYQRDLALWKKMPLWKRLRQKKPTRPVGI